MSYSRWSNSYWYTYWSDFPIEGYLYDDNKLYQAFTICCWDKTFYFTYDRLKMDMDGCIKEVEDFDKDLPKDETGRILLMNELKDYMFKFLYDMEKQYNRDGILYITKVKKL